MADDPGIGEQPLDVLLAEPGDLLEVEPGERLSEVLALAQDRQPGEPGLEPLEDELLEETAVVVDREAPLGVVVGLVLGRRGAPEAARDAVLTLDESLVGQSSAPFRVSQVITSTDMRPARTEASPSAIRRFVSSMLVR